MPYLDNGPNYVHPFGANSAMRSTHGYQVESYSASAADFPSTDIDGAPEKILWKGTILCKITSGPEAGKVGPFQTDATDGREDIANAVGVSHSFRPWQLNRGDIEVGAVYHGTFYLDRCLKYDDATSGAVPITQADADELRGKTHIDLLFV